MRHTVSPSHAHNRRIPRERITKSLARKREHTPHRVRRGERPPARALPACSFHRIVAWHQRLLCAGVCTRSLGSSSRGHIDKHQYPRNPSHCKSSLPPTTVSRLSPRSGASSRSSMCQLLRAVCLFQSTRNLYSGFEKTSVFRNRKFELETYLANFVP